MFEQGKLYRLKPQNNIVAARKATWPLFIPDPDFNNHTGYDRSVRFDRCFRLGEIFLVLDVLDNPTFDSWIPIRILTEDAEVRIATITEEHLAVFFEKVHTY